MFLNNSKFIERRLRLSSRFEREYPATLDGYRTERSADQILDLSAPSAVEVEIEVSEAAEVLMSICALVDRDDYDTLDLGAPWLKARLATVPKDLLEAIDALTLELEGRGTSAGVRLRDAEASDVRRVPRAAAGDRRDRAQEASVRLLRQLGLDLSAPDVIERAAAGDATRRRSSSVPRRVLGEVRVGADAARADGEELKAQLPRPPPALVRPRLPAGFAGVERGGRARRGRQAGARGSSTRRNSWSSSRRAATSTRRHPGSARLRFFPAGGCARG